MGKIKLNHLLLAGVATLWGVIFYRIISGISTETVDYKPAVYVPKKNISTDTKDTFTLSSYNYSDPFLKGNYEGKQYKQTAFTSAKEHLKTVKIVEKPKKSDVQQEVAVSDYVKYLGMAMDGNTKKKVAWIRWKEREQIVKEGEFVEDLQIIYFDKNKAVLTKRGSKDRIEIALHGSVNEQ